VLEFPEGARVTSIKSQNVRLQCGWDLRKVQKETIRMVTPDGQTDPEAWNALKFRMKAAAVPNWAQRSQEISFKIYMGLMGGHVK
jgi:hypothetical protein